MAQLDTSLTGFSGGASPEEEAMQKLVSSITSLKFEPVMLCGWRSFSTWLEILCGTSLGLGISGGGAGKREFMQAAEAAGRISFKLSRETVNTRSAMAWQVEEQRVVLIRNPRLDPDEIAFYDRRRFAI